MTCNFCGLTNKAAAHPEEAPLREPLAKGLVNSIYDARKAQDRQTATALLDELRALAAAHPDEAPLREQLTKGLVNAIEVVTKDGDWIGA